MSCVVLTGLMERKLVLESCLASGRWQLPEMFTLLTDDMIEFHESRLPSDILRTYTLRTQLTPLVKVNFKLSYSQDYLLSLLIAKCPVSTSLLLII